MTLNLEAIKARHDAYYKCKISVGGYLNSLRTDIPALVAEVERLRVVLGELVTLKDDQPIDYGQRKPLAWQAARDALKQ